MNILIINLILTTAENGVIIRRNSIRDCMICNFARGFIANGHKVTLLAAEDFRPLKEETYPFEVIYFKSRWPSVFKPGLLPYPIGFIKYLKENHEQFDMVVSSEAFSIGTWMAARVCPQKLVVWQEMAFHQHLLFSLPSKLWHNLVVRHYYKKAIAVGRSEKARNFISKYMKHVSNVIVDHGADADVLFPASKNDDAFIVMSQLSKRKNIQKTIAIFASFIKNQKYSHYKLNIVGDGPEEKNLKDLVKKLTLTDSVNFLGFLCHEKAALLLRHSKAMLINTISDLNMVSIPESIISGTPVVMNTVPTSASFIKENHLGIVRDSWDSQDLEKLVNNYETYHQSCISIRDSLTNVGCAKRMTELFIHHNDNCS